MSLPSAVLSAIHDGVDHLADLSERLEREKGAIVKAVQILKKRSLVEIVGPDAFDQVFCETAPARYVLTEAGQQAAANGTPIVQGQSPRQRKKTAGLRACAWWELRAHGTTTLNQILMTHANGTEKAADTNLLKYLGALEKARIIARQARRIPARNSRGRVQWRLVLDLGVQAPVWWVKTREIYDPNSKTVFPMIEAEVKEGGR
jgi:DNA-binding MarR family transcriptional regulator